MNKNLKSILIIPILNTIPTSNLFEIFKVQSLKELENLSNFFEKIKININDVTKCFFGW